ncbi:Hypothetical protein Y17_2656 [Pectobacterium wasabiae CFBP 3304]|nr:Hypothetical protein Y17_2656 [Pectobacterium wasabiae CFBP 3304]
MQREKKRLPEKGGVLVTCYADSDNTLCPHFSGVKNYAEERAGLG